MDELIKILRNSIEGEKVANFKYELFSEQALKENLPVIAYVFKVVAYAETIHLRIHMDSLERIKEDSSAIEKQIQINKVELKNQVNRTIVNLLNSRVSETFEFLDKYRNFALIAKKYQEPIIEKNFSNVKRAERSHAELFQDYLIFLDDNKEIEFKKLYVCEKCGTVRTEIPSERCPGCENLSNFFIEIHK